MSCPLKKASNFSIAGVPDTAVILLLNKFPRGSSSIESLQQLAYQISEVNASENSPALNEASSFVQIRNSSELHDTDKYKEALQVQVAWQKADL